MITRPSVPAMLTLLSQAVARPDVAKGNELILSAQLLAIAARRAALEAGYIASEIDACRELGEMVLAEELGDVAAMRSALDELHRHGEAGTLAARDNDAYALASEVLCLAVDATDGTEGPAASATLHALRLREENQARIVADFTMAGR